MWIFDGKKYPNAYKRLDWIIGLHHTHMIPKGLPGEGNILIYDNGGRGGYGAPNPGSPNGMNNAIRDSSRVIEIDPTTLRIVWEYSGRTMGYRDEYKIYSSYVSSAQRLPNGNTLVTNGSVGQFHGGDPGSGDRLGVHQPLSSSKRGSSTWCTAPTGCPTTMCRSCRNPWRRPFFLRITASSGSRTLRRSNNGIEEADQEDGL